MVVWTGARKGSDPVSQFWRKAWMDYCRDGGGLVGWFLVLALLVVFVVLVTLAGCASHGTGVITDAATGEPAYYLDFNTEPKVPAIVKAAAPVVATWLGLPSWAVTLAGLIGAGLGTEALRQHRNNRRLKNAYRDTVDELAETNPEAVTVAKRVQQRTNTREIMRKHLNG